MTTMEKVCEIEGCEKPKHGRVLCQMHYKRSKRHGDPLGFAASKDREARFEANTEWRGECLIWTGAKLPSGYGRFWADNRRIYAHRWAYERAHGSIPDGLEVDHLCWTRDCVNAAHLRAVTHAENMRNLRDSVRGGA